MQSIHGGRIRKNHRDPETQRTRAIPLVRAAIPTQGITWQRLPGSKVAHIRIASFRRGISEELDKALTIIRQQSLRGIILDLRNNPGGLVDESVSAVSKFQAGGNVLFERNAKGELLPIKARPSGPVCDLRMAVLVNRGTASSAEIAAGALRT